jgi:vesicle coat complex subunit
VEESIIAIRKIIEQNPSLILKILPKLLQLLSTAKPKAKESIYWLFGRYGHETDSVSRFAPDILRLSALSFPQEETFVKLQILRMAFKLKCLYTEDDKIGRLFDFLLRLAQFDSSYDVRDYVRMLVLIESGQLQLQPDQIKRISNFEISFSAKEIKATSLHSEFFFG